MRVAFQGVGDGQREVEGRALAGLRIEPDSTAMLFDHLADDRQARATAAAECILRVQALEYLEHTALSRASMPMPLSRT